jgi:hypothetical protein
MPLREYRRVFVGLIACAALAFAAPVSAQTSQVESFTATGVMNCALPGAPTPGGVSFSTTTTLQSLDFAPGSTVFNGMSIDFDGQEPTFLASDYNATLETPVGMGPAIALVTGTGTVLGGGGGGGGGGGCMVVAPDVPLGPMFSPTRLDVLAGPGISVTTTLLEWNSSAVPQLNERVVSAEGPVTITGVDAVNGIVNFSMSGSIVAGTQAVPALTMLGSMCLAIGLFGLAIVAIFRKSVRRGPAAG